MCACSYLHFHFSIYIIRGLIRFHFAFWSPLSLHCNIYQSLYIYIYLVLIYIYIYIYKYNYNSFKIRLTFMSLTYLYRITCWGLMAEGWNIHVLLYCHIHLGRNPVNCSKYWENIYCFPIVLTNSHFNLILFNILDDQENNLKAKSATWKLSSLTANIHSLRHLKTRP